MSQPWGFSCKGGLNVNLNQLEMLSQPGFATRLRNFEVDPDGGYRRVDGFTQFGDTNPNSSEVNLGMAVYADGVIVCSGTGIFFSQDGETFFLNQSGLDEKEGYKVKVRTDWTADLDPSLVDMSGRLAGTNKSYKSTIAKTFLFRILRFYLALTNKLKHCTVL